MKTSLPTDANNEETFRFQSGIGGELSPVMTLDKPLDELTNFDVLVSESELMKKEWQLVVIAALSGKNGVMPDSKEALKSLEIMMKTVETGGSLSKYMIFDKQGIPLVFNQ